MTGAESCYCWCDHCESDGELAISEGSDALLCPNCGHYLDVVAERQAVGYVVLRGPATASDRRRALEYLAGVAEGRAV